MYKYAWVTENSANEHEVFNITRAVVEDDITPKFVERIELAISQGYEIFGMKTTQWGYDAFVGATWDGTGFSGAMDAQALLGNPDGNSLENTEMYVFLANNKVIFTNFIGANTAANQIFQAAFTQTVRMIKIPDNQIVTQGYIWDGTSFNPPA